ncbi:MAG: SDR family oxidoreductase [Actinobacteria bacterium]|jgi:3alpha(or 20beta)-hydroxysteroid dehydrogenase|nr:MAG: SDR family oxidoreductase [Actinomycetota bacterium]
MFSLDGKVAVITGAASGLGKATALRFARAGAKVVLADITDAKEVAVEAGGIYVKTDVSQEEEVKELMQAAVSEYGKLTTVVNNAGIGGQMGTLDSITREGIDEALDINFKGVLWGIKHAAPLIADGGSIMNTASYAGLFGTPTYGCYVASKAAIIAITKTAALELAPRGIRVNCICPGTADTPMAYIEGAEVELKLACMLQPLGRLVQPEEVAALYHFLASDDCAMVTGLAIPIDGGMTAGPGLGVIGPLYEKIFSESLDIEDFKAEG